MLFVVMGLDGRDVRNGWRGVLTGGGGLAGIDVADNDDVDVETVVLTVDAESAGDPIRRGWMDENLIAMERCVDQAGGMREKNAGRTPW